MNILRLHLTAIFIILCFAAPSWAELKEDTTGAVVETPTTKSLAESKGELEEIHNGGGMSMTPNFMFSVATLVLAAVSVIIALAAVVGGFVIPIWIHRVIEKELNKAKNSLSDEMHKTATRQGDIVKNELTASLAVLSGRVGRMAFGEGTSERAIFINEAVSLTESSLKRLRDLEPTHPVIPIMENNLGYYLSLRKKPEDGHRARQIGQKLFIEFEATKNYERLNTYASIVDAFSSLYAKSDMLALLTLLDAVIADANIEEWHRRNAERHAASLRKVLERIT